MNLHNPFHQRNLKVVALSAETVASRHAWSKDIIEMRAAHFGFPILVNASRKVSQLYDMIYPDARETLAARSLFVIDPRKKMSSASRLGIR